MTSVRIEGLEKLQRKLKSNVTMDDVKKVVKKNGAELHTKIVQNAEFTKGYQTGTTKQSIRSSVSDGGLTWTVEPTTEYSPYLEYGTRFMEAQPFVKPALNKQKPKFFADLEKLMK